jgi:hypothetical protein
VVSYGFGKAHQPVTKNPDLSLWRIEGYTLPKDIISFFEQQIEGECVTMIRWRPKPKQTPDEVGST